VDLLTDRRLMAALVLGTSGGRRSPGGRPDRRV